MLIVSVVLFAIAAVWGIYLAISILGAKKLTTPLVLGHGVIAAIGLVVFIIASVTMGFVFLNSLSIILFVLAALTGAFMFLREEGPTTPLLGVHAILAVTAFLLLLIFTFAAKPA